MVLRLLRATIEVELLADNYSAMKLGDPTNLLQIVRYETVCSSSPKELETMLMEVEEQPSTVVLRSR